MQALCVPILRLALEILRLSDTCRNRFSSWKQVRGGTQTSLRKIPAVLMPSSLRRNGHPWRQQVVNWRVFALIDRLVCGHTNIKA